MKNNTIVRFAPSPTGILHIGGIRTLLYNYLFIKKKKGKFILRIEDTDKQRFIKNSEQYIINSLKWLQIYFNESSSKIGKSYPYRQSERKSLYKNCIRKLLNSNNIYYAFDKLEDLNKIKIKNQSSLKYNLFRNIMKNSFTLSKNKILNLINYNIFYIIRIKIPFKVNIIFKDLLRKFIIVNSFNLDDKILIKSNGISVYHFVNIIDDYFMRINYIIRGEEWLSSFSIHLILYKYLNWYFNISQFLHLPLLFNPSGKGKLSKRNMIKKKIPLFPINYKFFSKKLKNNNFQKKGYFSEVLINFLVKLGWNFNDKEVSTKKCLIKNFNIFKLGKSGIRFDYHKLNWYNQKYLRNKKNNYIINFLLRKLKKSNINFNYKKVLEVYFLIKERSIFLDDFFKKGKDFFQFNNFCYNKLLKKKCCNIFYNILKELIFGLKFIKFFNYSKIKLFFLNIIKKNNIKPKKIMFIIRFLLIGNYIGPDLIKIMEILKKKETIFRVKKYINFFF